MFSDFFVITYWWLVLFLLGLLFLPLAVDLFSSFWDRGWIFAKTIGIVVVSYLVFLFGRIHLFPFCRETIFLFLVLILIGNIFYLRKKKRKEAFLRTIKMKGRIFLGEEGVFFLALAGWSFIRGFQPRIEGLEKFMDFGFVNSILRSSWFPPLDMWFAGEPINYYYFGHLQGAVLTKLSGLDSAVTYNLLVATVFALAFVSTFSLTGNLARLAVKKLDRKGKKLIILAGFISAFLLCLGGNLHSVVYVLKKGAANYWYPDATRFIGYEPNNPDDKTIHEFPLYSFVVADLHGHMNDIPTVLLFLTVLFVLGKASLSLREKEARWFLPGLGFLLAVMYMTNSWDFPIYGIIFALFLFLAVLSRTKFSREGIFSLLKEVLPKGFFVLLFAVLFSLPFSLSFSPMTDGIGLVRAHSLWWQLLILWGFFWFTAVSFWIFFFSKKKKTNWADIFLFSATVWATVLIVIPEIIYVKDIYIPAHHRSNTMFKLVYQSFIIYSLASGYILIRLKQFLAEKKRRLFLNLFLILFLLGFSCQMIYPHFAIKGYYGILKPGRYQGLYGMGFLKQQYPDDYKAVLWLKKNVSGQPVILEATGDSYTLYNRVSAMTGIPTIQGWLVHEWLWRGGYDRPGARAAEVEAIYGGGDEVYARSLLAKYKVEYILIGDLERIKYPHIDEERIAKWGDLLYSSGETKIYRLK